jgi:hypothetical protein
VIPGCLTTHADGHTENYPKFELNHHPSNNAHTLHTNNTDQIFVGRRASLAITGGRDRTGSMTMIFVTSSFSILRPLTVMTLRSRISNVVISKTILCESAIGSSRSAGERSLILRDTPTQSVPSENLRACVSDCVLEYSSFLKTLYRQPS